MRTSIEKKLSDFSVQIYPLQGIQNPVVKSAFVTLLSNAATETQNNANHLIAMAGGLIQDLIHFLSCMNLSGVITMMKQPGYYFLQLISENIPGKVGLY